jgi:tryptophan synthase alpha chain
VNRIVQRFADLRAQGRKGLVIYIGAGDPNLEATRQLALAFDQAGVDVLELGVPFSDPLADGIVNQLAAQRGLARDGDRPVLHGDDRPHRARHLGHPPHAGGRRDD